MLGKRKFCPVIASCSKLNYSGKLEMEHVIRRMRDREPKYPSVFIVQSAVKAKRDFHFVFALNLN